MGDDGRVGSAFAPRFRQSSVKTLYNLSGTEQGEPCSRPLAAPQQPTIHDMFFAL